VGQCDGRRPVCSRCRDYEHTCTWLETKTDRSRLGGSVHEHPNPSSTTDPLQLAPSSENYSIFRQAIQSYGNLFNSIQYSLSETDRAVVESTLSSIRQRLSGDTGLILPARTSNTTILAEPITLISPGRRSTIRQRYLGEASELRFYHSVKQVLRDDQISEATQGSNLDGYDQEDNYMAGPNAGRIAANPPSRQLADTYIDIYFSTIHIAYPFVCKPVFIANYEKFWRGGIESGKDLSWVPLLCRFYFVCVDGANLFAELDTVFALGAYYTSFPRSKGEGLQDYSQYFEYASALAAPVMTECTLGNIQILISQCLFLLATSQTDRCWTLLGLAIRIAQTIGLHVEDSHKRSLTSLSLLEEETMRRTWYTMYNLDRLLALQLGRPIAIHDDDYYVTLPSKAEDSYFSTDMEKHSPPLNGGPSFVDFFICVIRFSGVLGQVISDLYRPSQLKPDPDLMLANIATLDRSLLKWKNSLPRHLRFDLGHVFENSITFKRQVRIIFLPVMQVLSSNSATC
jgi:Fungal specific transcription factor domain